MSLVKKGGIDAAAQPVRVGEGWAMRGVTPVGHTIPLVALIAFVNRVMFFNVMVFSILFLQRSLFLAVCSLF